MPEHGSRPIAYASGGFVSSTPLSGVFYSPHIEKIAIFFYFVMWIVVCSQARSTNAVLRVD